jgi:hypothetical protein
MPDREQAVRVECEIHCACRNSYASPPEVLHSVIPSYTYFLRAETLQLFRPISLEGSNAAMLVDFIHYVGNGTAVLRYVLTKPPGVA